jgi:hypothetical protein
MSNPEATLERLGCADPKINGAGTVSAAAALYLASRFAARPQDGLLSAAFLRKADTDTLASLTAAILGALHDTHWLGNLAVGVQDADYIAQLAERSAAHVTDPPPWPSRHPQTLRRTLTNALRHRYPQHSQPRPVRNLYAQLTGHDIPVRDGTAEITSGLLLHQSAADALIDTSSVIVHITVDNLLAATRRIGLDTTTADDRNGTIEVRDPDGRILRISQRPSSSGPITEPVTWRDRGVDGVYGPDR